MSGLLHPELLTDKQRKFIAYYNGNAKVAAQQAGYPVEAHYLLKRPRIVMAIKTRNEDDPMVLSRIGRQRLWSKMAQDTTLTPMERLKASELLAKSEGDFITNVNVNQTHSLTLPEGLSAQDLRRLVKTPYKDIIEGEVVPILPADTQNIEDNVQPIDEEE